MIKILTPACAIMLFFIASCTTVKDLPDPRINCPTIPQELMQRPERLKVIEND